MNTEERKAIAEQAAKNIKTEQDLNEFRQMLTKITVEAALNAELDDHLGYARNKQTMDNSVFPDYAPYSHQLRVALIGVANFLFQRQQRLLQHSSDIGGRIQWIQIIHLKWIVYQII